MEAPFQFEIADVDHLPIIRKFAEKLGISDIVNDMVSTGMNLDVGKTLIFLILDTLSGRSPLYRVADRYTDLEVEALMGAGFEPSSLLSHNLGRMLDCLHETGTHKILSAISHRAVNVFSLNPKVWYFDTTSISLYGNAYPEPEQDSETPHVTHGYSKDHRPDLKQFLISLLCVDRNIPMLGRVKNGNASDVTLNNQVLTDVSKYLAAHGFDDKATIYVADSAMVSEDNLAKADQMRFLTRLPARYKECSRVIEGTVAENTRDWHPIGVLSQDPGSPNRPAAEYEYKETTVSLYGNTYRAIVVHSSAYDKRRQKAVDRMINKDHEETKIRCKKTGDVLFHCEEDAEDAARRLVETQSFLHSIQTRVATVFLYGKGRPPKGKERNPLRTDYRIETEICQNEETITKLRREAGCIVLLTNLASEAEREEYDAKALLTLYKEQYGIEQNFGFLKDPAIVDGIFLKKPERIEVLGLIMILALMIWRLMEREMRQYLDRTGEDLSDWPKRRTTRPTSFMMTTKFHSIKLIRFEGKLILAQSFTETQNAWLKALGVKPADFLPPPN
ncbi:IS1634 family transposase [Desulfobotulus mexicanus]|uniref:IS1634 family transposase n=1 Tax=Desulfobotulus mexicanus TaxID=2586642 RepID=A0A5Q4VGZ1_9BACT|nr:IS1634 family transposase [Desulfobotulus mexicanus]TYT76203.1 IS1634 family transposase [Desulfobotulus mexicanus]